MLQCIVSPNMVVCKPTWCEFFFGYTMPLIIAIRVRFIFLSAKSSTSYRNQWDQIWPDCNIQEIHDAMKGMFLCSVLQLPTALFTFIGMNSKFINIIAASFALVPWVATDNVNLF